MPELLRYGVAIARTHHQLCLIVTVGLALATVGCSNSGSSATTATETMTATVTVTSPQTGSTSTPTTPPATTAAATTPERLAGYCPTTAVCDDFKSPTGNIKCFATSAQGGLVECSIGSGLNPPPAPSSCDLDQPGLGLPAAGKAAPLCRGDASPSALDSAIPVLAYGHSWRGFGISCLSQTRGMTCSNPDGHRFFLSRQRWTIS